MAPKLYPDSEVTRVVFASAAEEQFYDQARANLGDDWSVFHSCTLSTIEGEAGLKDNEIDFVCYHPRLGVVVIEVKGGRIRFDAERGTFFSVNRHGDSFAIKNPFTQALTWKGRFVRFLKQHQIRVPVSHAVCFPGAGEDEFPATSGVVPELIIGRNKLRDLAGALRTIVQTSQPEQYLNFTDCGLDLERLLVGSSFTTRMYLRDYIDGHEHRLKDLETIQETLITPIASTPRLGIEGEAGTGKTMIAIMLARHFRDLGRRVLLLGSNSLLNLLIKRDLGDGIESHTYSELAATFGVNLLQPASDFGGEKDDWIQYEAPERLKTAIAASPLRFDVLICDEAQDVQPFWWEAIEGLLDSAQEQARFYVFFDSSQGLFGAGDGQRFVAGDVLPLKPPYFPLVYNYRTTREIAAFSRAFRTTSSILPSHSGRLGYVPELMVYKDSDDARRLLAQLVTKLTRDEAVNHDEITLISARNPAAKESVLYQTDEVASMPLHRLTHQRKKSWKEARPPAGALGVTTIAAFKGLETTVGILLNVSEYNLPADNPIMASLIYVACTRAKHMLYVFVKADDPKRAAFAKALAAIRTSGSMVLEGGSRADFEFVGRVSHWNPERVGWLAVDDPAFQLGSVMFFPADVRRAEITDLRVGARLRFRPRVEGPVTIAADLSVAADAKPRGAS